jgi:hypothetical protein
MGEAEARETCRAAESDFHGACMAVAVALHERTGWPITFWYPRREAYGYHATVLRPARRPPRQHWRSEAHSVRVVTAGLANNRGTL